MHLPTKQYRRVIALAFSGLCFLPGFVHAGLTYQPLVGIPGVDNAASNFNQYINQLYFVSISIAALLAVIKIIIGGVKWMLTDVVTQKSDAKNDIRSALLGLLLIIAAYLILSTINPQLTNLRVLQDAPPVQLSVPQAQNGTGPTTQTPDEFRNRTIANSGASTTVVTAGGLPARQFQAPWFSEACQFDGQGTVSRPCTYRNFNTLPGGSEAFNNWRSMRDINPCGPGESRVESNYIRIGGGTINQVPSRITCVANP